MSRFDPALIARAVEAVRRAQEARGGADAPAGLPPSDGAPGEALSLAAGLCRRFEGFRSRPYLCPAGVATIGYGTTVYPGGARVALTDPAIDAATANRFLLLQLRRDYLPALVRACPSILAQSPGRVAALLDWTYNLGAGNLMASTLRRRVNAGDWARVPAELARWVHGGGRVLPGLVARRQAEAALC